MGEAAARWTTAARADRTRARSGLVSSTADPLPARGERSRATSAPAPDGPDASYPPPPERLPSLRDYRDRQAREREAAGADWKDSGYVFTRPDASPIEGATLTRRFNALLRRATLRRIRFHDLRHSAATLLFEQGVELVVITQLLGHAHIGVTATVYVHVRLRLQRDAIDLLGRALHDPEDRAARPDDGNNPPLCAAPVR